jgi:hypothetical protein
VIIIGLLLVIAAAVFGLDLMWKNTFRIQNPVVFGQSLGIHSAAVFFLVGAITGAVLILGIALVLLGVRRKGRMAVRHHREGKQASKAQADRSGLESDNAALRHELDEQQTVQPPPRQPDP